MAGPIDIPMADRLPDRDQRDLYFPAGLDLDALRWTSVLYYLPQTNPDNGLVHDKGHNPRRPSSIGRSRDGPDDPPCRRRAQHDLRESHRRARPAAGCGFLSRRPGAGTRTPLDYKGFFYSFLDIEKFGRRSPPVQLLHESISAFPSSRRDPTSPRTSIQIGPEATISSAKRSPPGPTQGARRLNKPNARTAQPGPAPALPLTTTKARLLLYVLGLSSPTHPLPPES